MLPHHHQYHQSHLPFRLHHHHYRHHDRHHALRPAQVHADGIWLDGIGPDNGAYMCSGVCCGSDATNSPLIQRRVARE